MFPTQIWKLYAKLFNITKPYIKPYLAGDGNGFFFGSRNRKEFFLSLLSSYQSDVAVTLQADEIRNRLDRVDIDPTFRFLFPLGKEYWLRPVSAAPEYYMRSILHWIENNPPGSKMWYDLEVSAIRAINWIAGYHLFSDHSSITKQFLEHFLRSIYLHGRLFSNCRRKVSKDNKDKLIVLIAAQLIGTLFFSHRSGKRWHDRSVRQIDYMMVQEDGETVDESFIRRLEFYTISYCASKQFNVNRRPEALNNLHHKYNTAARAGNYPEIKRTVLRYTLKEETSLMNGLLPIGAVLFRDPGLKKKSSKFSEDALWLSGTEGFEIFRSISI